MTCCTYGCTGAPGCAVHATSLSIACCGRADCLDVSCPGRPTDDGENHHWSDLTRLESTAIWIIVSLCALLVLYFGFLAWQFV